MTLLSPPASRGGPPPEDLDRLLGALFRASGPAAPVAAAPRRRRLRTGRRAWPLMRSRLALAASVALLATGLLFLAGAFRDGRAQAGPATAGDPPERDDRGYARGVRSRLRRTRGKLKINESLIQEPNGTTIHVDVIDWPTTPK